MTRSSKTRRAKARAKKYANKHTCGTASEQHAGAESSAVVLNATDKRYLLGFTILSLIITAVYWSMGGRNLFVFPALICISVGARKYWTGPIRRFADQS